MDIKAVTADKALLGLRSCSKLMPDSIRDKNATAKQVSAANQLAVYADFSRLSGDLVHMQYGSIPITARQEISAYTTGEM